MRQAGRKENAGAPETGRPDTAFGDASSGHGGCRRKRLSAMCIGQERCCSSERVQQHEKDCRPYASYAGRGKKASVALLNIPLFSFRYENADKEHDIFCSIQDVDVTINKKNILPFDKISGIGRAFVGCPFVPTIAVPFTLK